MAQARGMHAMLVCDRADRRALTQRQLNNAPFFGQRPTAKRRTLVFGFRYSHENLVMNLDRIIAKNRHQFKTIYSTRLRSDDSQSLAVRLFLWLLSYDRDLFRNRPYKDKTKRRFLLGALGIVVLCGIFGASKLNTIHQGPRG